MRFIENIFGFSENFLRVTLPSAEAESVTPEVTRLLQVLTMPMSRSEIQEALSLRDADHVRISYIAPALHQGLIEMTIPDMPNSRLQKYRPTKSGRLTADRGNDGDA